MEESGVALELHLACLEEWLSGKSPRVRVRFLRGLTSRLEAEIAAPVSLRGPRVKATQELALEVLRKRLPRLMAPDG